MSRNIGVLIRQTKLLGNGNRSCLPGLVHHRKLVSSSIQTLSSSPSSIPSSSSPIIPLSSTPKLPFSYNYYSLIHSQNLHFMPPSDSDSDSESDSDLDSYSDLDLDPDQTEPLSAVLVQDAMLYNEALGKARDGRTSVFFYTTPFFWRISKWYLKPIFDHLGENEPLWDIYVVYLEQDGTGTTLDQLGVKSPTFHFYLEGEKVDELASPCIPGLRKVLAKVSNKCVKKERRRRAEEDENDGGVDLSQDSQVVEVLPSSFPASSLNKLMEAVESLPGEAVNDRLWCFAKGLFSSQEKREQFCSIEDPYLKLEWLQREAE